MEQKTLYLIKIPRVPSMRRHRCRLIRHRRNKAAGGLVTIAAVSLMLNIVQAVVIYILQAGPI